MVFYNVTFWNPGNSLANDVQDPANGKGASMMMASAGQGSLPGSGPRFVVNEWPTDVTFTPERGCTIECSVWGQPAPHVAWLTSRGTPFVTLLGRFFPLAVFTWLSNKRQPLDSFVTEEK